MPQPGHGEVVVMVVAGGPDFADVVVPVDNDVGFAVVAAAAVGLGSWRTGSA